MPNADNKETTSLSTEIDKLVRADSVFLERMSFWTLDEVEIYLREVMNPEDHAHAERSIAKIRNQSVDGIGLLLHEMAEMTYANELLIAQDKPGLKEILESPLLLRGIYRNARVKMELGYPHIYTIAHGMAIKEEFKFLARIALQLGFNCSPAALFIASPRMRISNSSEELFVGYKSTIDLQVKPSFINQEEFSTQPSHKEIDEALRFWREVA